MGPGGRVGAHDLDDEELELDQEHEEQEHQEHQHCHAPAARATRGVSTHHTACTREGREHHLLRVGSFFTDHTFFTAKFALRIASLSKNLETTWESWGKPLGRNVKAVIQRMTAVMRMMRSAIGDLSTREHGQIRACVRACACLGINYQGVY